MAEIDDKELEELQKAAGAITELTQAMNDLKEANSKLEANNQSLLDEKRKAKEDAQKAAEDAAKSSGDTEALEQSYKEKIQAVESDKNASIQALTDIITAQNSGMAAKDMAVKLAMDGEHLALLPHIEGRFSTEIVEGKPVKRILDANGKPSAMTEEDLEAEIKAVPYLARILKGTSADGAGSANKGGVSSKKFQEHTGAELKEIKERNPAEYQRLKAAYDDEVAGMH